MPIIRFTEADKLAGKLLEAGPYSVELTEIDGPRASKSQKSVSYFATFRIIDGKFMNKEFEVAFNSESSGASILGTMMWAPVRDLMKVQAAIEGKKFDDIQPGDLDTDQLLYRPFDIITALEKSGGELVSFITSYLPVGTAATANQVPY